MRILGTFLFLCSVATGLWVPLGHLEHSGIELWVDYWWATVLSGVIAALSVWVYSHDDDDDDPFF